MKSISETFSELRTAAIIGGVTADEITEAVKGLSTEEGAAKLKELTESRNITIPNADDHYSQEIAKLTEKLVKSGKVTGFQIMESLKTCSNEKERFTALQSLAVAKKIDVKPVQRKNGSQTPLSESDSTRPDTQTRVKQVMKDFRFSEKEACLYLGIEYISESCRGRDEKDHQRMKILKTFGFSEADSVKILERGLYMFTD